MTEVTIEEVLAALSERGRLEWEAAPQRAILEAPRREIASLMNGHEPEMIEAVLDPEA